MKCAAEMVMIRNNANHQHEMDEIAKAMEFFKMACANSIELCEGRISQLLEEEANSYGNDKVSIELVVDFYEDKYQHLMFRGVKRQIHCYVNGDDSWEIECNKSYEYNTLKKYLEDHCYTVKMYKNSFKTKRYGFGEWHYDTIAISTKPECV